MLSAEDFPGCTQVQTNAGQRNEYIELANLWWFLADTIEKIWLLEIKCFEKYSFNYFYFFNHIQISWKTLQG